MSLTLTMMIFRGLSTRRRTLTLEGISRSSDVAFVTQKVLQTLDSTPDEVQFLVGTEVLAESASLMDNSTFPLSGVKALVWYNVPDTLKWEDPKQASESEAETADFLSEEPGAADEFLSGPLECEVSEQAPPPILMERNSRPSRTVENLGTMSEQDELAQGRRFILAVHGNIFLGKRFYQRSCMIPVSGETTVGELETRIEAWLGSRSDELVLTFGEATLKSHLTLADHHLGPDAKVSMMAWYKDACARDLPAKLNATTGSA